MLSGEAANTHFIGHNIMDFAMPYMIQVVREYISKVRFYVELWVISWQPFFIWERKSKKTSSFYIYIDKYFEIVNLMFLKLYCKMLIPHIKHPGENTYFH
jgi:hypothetical protein